ncbi:MAG TPA: PIG-L deacetylase family protein [Dehalococcoidales bacterium]|nr:PIG-L deacetylase family protein [Dehalococcoidales bacterium]
MNNYGIYLLAFTPHPTDIEMGMGGTVARLVKEGKEVVFVVGTNSETSSSNPEMKPDKLARIRKKEQLDSAKILGVKEVVFLDQPDLGLEATPAFKKDILRLILKYRPEVVATHDPYFHIYQSNPDHRVMGRVVLDAVWPTALAPNAYPDLQKEGYTVHKVQQIWLFQSDKNNYYVDITDTLELKKKALDCRGSERAASFRNDAGAGVIERAKLAAKGQDYQYGEAFYKIDVLQRL